MQFSEATKKLILKKSIHWMFSLNSQLTYMLLLSIYYQSVWKQLLNY